MQVAMMEIKLRLHSNTSIYILIHPPLSCNRGKIASIKDTCVKKMCRAFRACTGSVHHSFS